MDRLMGSFPSPERLDDHTDGASLATLAVSLGHRPLDVVPYLVGLLAGKDGGSRGRGVLGVGHLLLVRFLVPEFTQSAPGLGDQSTSPGGCGGKPINPPANILSSFSWGVRCQTYNHPQHPGLNQPGGLQPGG